MADKENRPPSSIAASPLHPSSTPRVIGLAPSNHHIQQLLQKAQPKVLLPNTLNDGYKPKTVGPAPVQTARSSLPLPPRIPLAPIQQSSSTAPSPSTTTPSTPLLSKPPSSSSLFPLVTPTNKLSAPKRGPAPSTADDDDDEDIRPPLLNPVPCTPSAPSVASKTTSPPSSCPSGGPSLNVIPSSSSISPPSIPINTVSPPKSSPVTPTPVVPVPVVSTPSAPPPAARKTTSPPPPPAGKNPDFGNGINVNSHPYLTLSKIGSGGYGTVWQVVGDGGHKQYALKEMKHGNDMEKIRSCEVEIKQLELFNNEEDQDNVIQIKEWQRTQEKIYIVLEKGDYPLGQYLERSRQKTPRAHCYPSGLLRRDVGQLWEKLLQCVERVHAREVIHRDIKPDNFVCVGGQWKIIDFGIGKQIANAGESTGVISTEIIGSLNYMPPEAFNPISSGAYEIHRAGDIWAMGCLLYRMVYGAPPFNHIPAGPGGLNKIKEIIDPRKPIPFPQDSKYAPIEADVLDVMQSCLNRDPRLRPRVNELLIHPYLTSPSSSNNNSDSSSSSLTSSTSGMISLDTLDHIVRQALAASSSMSSSADIILHNLKKDLRNGNQKPTVRDRLI